MKSSRKLSCASIALAALLALHGVATADEHEHEPDTHAVAGEAATGAADVVAVTAGQQKALGIETAVAAPARIEAAVELFGEVEANGDQVAHIVPRFAGVVQEVRKVAGDTVRAGDVLAVIESNESLARYDLKTRIDGTVLAKHLTIGEAVSPDKQAYLVANLGSVWVHLSVYQKDLAGISIGQSVRIHSVQEGSDAEGKISYISPVVEHTTRTATARIVLANPDRRWLPGMFVTGHTIDDHPAAVAIPRSALQRLGEHAIVFVEAPGGFAPRVVTLGRQGESLSEVLSGLSVGERFVTRNSFLLKAELAKGEAEEEEH